MKLSHLSETLIGSEIVKLGGEIREKMREGAQIYNFTVGDFDPSIFPIPQDLEEDIGDTPEKMSMLIVEARKALTNVGLLSKEFCTAADIMTRRNQIMRCTTGSESLDGFITGGIEMNLST